MEYINKSNINDFLQLYHYLHDATIKSVLYDASDARVDMNIKVFWKGEVKLKENNTYESSNILLKMHFYDVEKLKIQEMFSYDYIDDINIDYVIIDNKEYIKFEDIDNNLIVISNEISYEEEIYEI